MDNNENVMNELDELSDLFDDLGSSLGSSNSKLEESTSKQVQEGFACLFPEWDLHPVKR